MRPNFGRSDEAVMRASWWKPVLCELLASCAVTFVAAGAICTDRYSGGELGLIGIALAYALSFGVMVTATRATSGGHVNPAITLGVYLTGSIEATRASLYGLAQLIGASLAGLMLLRTYSVEIWQPANLGTPTLGEGVSPFTGMFIEAVLTSFLVFVYLFSAGRSSPSVGIAGSSTGAALLCGILLGGPLTGAAMNPARAFGPALASGAWSHHWIYWIGPLVGAILGALAYSAFRTDTTRNPAH
jgi:MIP family channel proteins